LPVLIIGESGSGKTYSIKNLNPDEVGIFSVEKNRLPFEKQFKIAKNATYAQIKNALKNPKLKTYIIDDSTFLIINQVFDRAKETGYAKFTETAKEFRDLIHDVNKDVPDDVVVYFLHHVEDVPNTGKIKVKTAGKMLDDVLDVPSCFDIVLLAQVENKEHYFITQTDGYTPAKSPEGMFELKIPNDLNFVNKRIREFYKLDNKEED
jgi:adenylate kinase family enzyme